MEAIVQPSTLKPAHFLGSQIVLATVISTTIGIRLWSQYHYVGKLQLDDYFCVVALAFLIWNLTTFYILATVLNSDPRDVTVEKVTTLCAIGIFASNSTMYTAKLPLLFLYIQTFGIKRWLRWTCKFLIVFSGLGFLTAATYGAVSCSPPLNGVDLPALFKCVTGITHACISRGSLSLTVDLIMFVLPLPIIKDLKLQRRRKIGLALVFMTGLLAIAASAAGLYFQTAQTGGSSSNFINALLITTIESSIVILVSCAPALHLFWNKQRFSRNHLDLSRLRTISSKFHLGNSGISKKEHESSCSTGPIKVTTHHYVELQDLPKSKGPAYEAGASRNQNLM
ncbi:hypothetical protein F5B18DRAFT_649797 [Nemania serpens]|nr:hypothetical protein F5B18DRAFT_649797 [Nemania serpens]